MPGTRLSLVALGLVSLACGERPADQPPAQPAGPPVIEIEASDFAYQAPDTLPAGPVTLRMRNAGPELHHVTMIRLADGKTTADLMQALAGGVPPDWAVMMGGPNTPVPGGVSEATVDLVPGAYVMLCAIPSVDGVLHVAKGMLKEVSVVEPPVRAAAPEADIVMRLVDYDFVLSQPLTAGRHVIRVEVEAGQQPHEVVLVRIAPGKTVAEVAAWAEKPEGPPPGEPLGGTSIISGGHYNLIPVDLTPGEYGLICFMPDVRDGKPHLVHGMMRQFTVM